MADFTKSANIIKVIDAQSVKAAIEINESNLDDLITDYNTSVTKNDATDIKSKSWTVDEDDMVSDLDTKVPTQQSVKAFVGAAIAAALPAGCIVMWSGAISAVPTGWYLCDGTNGTPDLTDRFVIHADADSGGTHNVGETGGSNTIEESNLPVHTHGDGTLATDIESGHSHNIPYSSSGGGTTSPPWGNGQTSTRTTSSAGAHAHDVTGETGDGGFANTDYKPKFYALAYIRKG